METLLLVSNGFRCSTLPASYVRPEPERPKLSEVADYFNAPIIDLGRADPKLIARQISQACQHYGFFQVINHGVPIEMMEKMLEEAGAVIFVDRMEATKSVRRRRRIFGMGRISCRHASRRQETTLMPAAAPPPPPLKELMKYGVTAVLGLLVLRYQSKPEALFGENPAPLWSFVASTTVYWLLLGAIKGRKRYEDILRRGALAFGIQSALSLLSMFLPRPLSLLPLLIWMLMLPLALFSAYTCHRPRIISVLNKLRAMARGLNSTNQSHNLPV